MPTFVLECIECNNIQETKAMCTHSKAKSILCDKCGCKTKINLQPVTGKVNGYSEANGYHRDELSYDGSGPDN